MKLEQITEKEFKPSCTKRILNAISKGIIYATAPLLIATSGISCDSEENNEPPHSGCISNNECESNQVCYYGECVEPLQKPEEETIEFCCGRIVYTDDHSSDLLSFDLKTKKITTLFPGHWNELYKSLDNSTIVLDNSLSTCSENKLHSYYSLLDADGTNLREVSFIPSCVEEGHSFSVPVPKILTNNSSLIAIFRGHFGNNKRIFRIDQDQTITQLTFSEEGVDEVYQLAVSPENKIYFQGSHYKHADSLFVMNSDGSDQTLVTELDFNFQEMHWVPNRDQLLVRNENKIYLLNPSDGFMEQLDIYSGHSGSDQTLLVSPDGDKIIYKSNTGLKMYDLNLDEKIEIRQYNFPECEKSDCLEINTGVWLP